MLMWELYLIAASSMWKLAKMEEESEYLKLPLEDQCIHKVGLFTSFCNF